MIKRYYIFSLLVALFLLGLLAGSALSVTDFGSGEQLSNLTVLDELSATLHKNGGVVEVKVAVKNVSNSYLKGLVTVYLLDANGKVINAKDEPVGNGLQFGPGAVAEFELTMKVPKKARIDTVSVDFVRE